MLQVQQLTATALPSIAKHPFLQDNTTSQLALVNSGMEITGA